MQNKINVNTFTSLIVTLIIFFLILDSGGEKHIRNIAIALILILAAHQKTFNFSNIGVLSYLIMVSLLCLSLIRPIALGIEIKTIAIWVIPILSIPIFVAFCRSTNTNNNHFIISGALFANLVILLFIGRLTGNPEIMELNEFLTSDAAGFFNYKQAFFSDELPVVYFQGTLCLVFIGVLAWGYKRYFIFSIILIALIVAPSRFGVFSVCVFALLYTLLKTLQFKYDRFFLTIAGITAVAFITLLSNEIFTNHSILALEFDPIRSGHLSSVIELLDDDPTIFITGAGPGSQFFSSGFEASTDNIEISQLELLRKYGILSFFFFHAFLILIVYRLVVMKKNIEIFALLSHYLVALSNPVIFSIPFLLFFACLIDQSQIKQFKISNKNTVIHNDITSQRNKPN